MTYKVLRAPTFSTAEIINPNGEKIVHLVPEPYENPPENYPDPYVYRWGVIAPGEKIGDELLLTFSKIALPPADQEPLQVPFIKLFTLAHQSYHSPSFIYPNARYGGSDDAGFILEIRLSAILPINQETGAEDSTPISTRMRWMGSHWLVDYMGSNVHIGPFQTQSV